LGMPLPPFFAVMELMVVSRRPKASAAADTGLKEL